MTQWTRVLLSLTRLTLSVWLATWGLWVTECMLGGRAQPWQVLVGAILGLLAALVPLHSIRLRVVAGVACCCCVAVAVIAAVVLPDASWDANLYHYRAAYAIADGWNPLIDSLPFVDASPDIVEVIGSYPKASWVLSACLYLTIGDIDSGNAIHWLMLVSVVGPALRYARYRMRASPRRSLVFAVVVASNPITLAQIASGYIDTNVASLFSILLFELLSAESRDRMRDNLATPLASACLLMGSKLTGLVYFGVVAMVVIAAALARRSWAFAFRLCLWCLCALLAIAFLACDSYPRNAVQHGNLFFPAWSSRGGGALVGQAAPEFLCETRFAKLAMSICSAQCNDRLSGDVVSPNVRWPLTSIQWRHQYDARFSGFGPLFFESVIVCIAVWMCCRSRPLQVAVVAVLASTLATDAGWWARLAPQLWLFPGFALLVDARVRYASPKSRGTRVMVCVLAAIMVANCMSVAAAGAGSALRVARQWRSAIAGQPTGLLSDMLARQELRVTLERRLVERTRR